MAGGRRPASYVSGARHHTSLERASVTADAIASPPLNSSAGPSLPPWIPSIWQPAPPKDPEPTSRERDRKDPVSSEPTVALAAALDAAVQSAVARALGSAALPVPGSPNLHTSSISSDMGFDEDSSSSNLSAKERELSELVESLQQRLADRDREFAQLSQKVASLERAVSAGTEAVHHRQDAITAQVVAHRTDMMQKLVDVDQKIAARVTPVHDQVKANQSAISKLRSSQKNKDAEMQAATDLTRDLSHRLNTMQDSLSAQVDRQAIKLEQLEKSFSLAQERLDETEQRDEESELKKEVQELKRSAVSSAEAASTMRSKVKRVESQMSEVSKKAAESMELSYAFEQALQSKFDEVQGTVSTLQNVIMEVYPAHDLNDGRKRNDDMASKMESLEANVQALKKLIESNLRTQWSAESIVKEQVSLITKHVCVAMRQYTARRISENNVLIDRALRARVPEYAKNEEEFVLVRKDDGEGNESIDIHKTAETSSLSEC